ncbi:hypothetical protein ACETIH_08050 [Microvirga arabica]|uniref:Uncharacterized protein n=1 Tax=Microvirga arabica TaxID=1128671 RepID=A0ABV6Y5W7_9HYPH
MARIKPVTLANGVLTFNNSGDYSFETLANGRVKIYFADGATTVLTKDEWASVKTFDIKDANANVTMAASYLDGKSYAFKGAGDLDVTGVTISEAVPGTGVSQNVNLDRINFGSVLDTVNGSKADYFKLMWDAYDEVYSTGSYYNTQINVAFIKLGVEYLEYLKAGGEPLTEFTGKSSATRDQSVHDNLLGNFNPVDFDSRFPVGTQERADLLARIEATGNSGIFQRGVFSGNSGDVGGASHDKVRAYDYDQGWERPDWTDSYFGMADERAQKAGTDDLIIGTGNSAAKMVITRHEGAGIELAIKVKEFGPNGGDTLNAPTFVDGVAHYAVSAGASPDNANRADWSVDVAATILAAGEDDAFTFKLLIDVDATAGTKMIEYPAFDASGQLSLNYGFGAIKNQIDIDPTTDGIQAYNYGAGQFDFELQAFDKDTGKYLASTKMVVDVLA